MIGAPINLGAERELSPAFLSLSTAQDEDALAVEGLLFAMDREETLQISRGADLKNGLSFLAGEGGTPPHQNGSISK